MPPREFGAVLLRLPLSELCKFYEQHIKVYCGEVYCNNHNKTLILFGHKQVRQARAGFEPQTVR